MKKNLVTARSTSEKTPGKYSITQLSDQNAENKILIQFALPRTCLSLFLIEPQV